MNARESIILSKILAELTAFLLHRGYRRFTTHVEVDEAIERITIEIPDFRPADSTELIQKCIRPREREIETYGWTLLGDSNLEMAGLLINTALAEVKGSTTVVTLTRLQD